jgi:C4-type Zn-finger protein
VVRGAALDDAAHGLRHGWYTLAMEDIRKGTCPMCRHNEIVEMPHATSTFNSVILMYVCRRCGHYQTAVARPDEIPVDKYGTRLIKGPEPEGPYR